MEGVSVKLKRMLKPDVELEKEGERMQSKNGKRAFISKC